MGICDEMVFKSIYTDLSDGVQRFIRSRGFDIEMAADIAQESFVRMWNHCQKIEKSKSKSYLYTTANNIIIDSVRKQQTRNKADKLLTIRQSYTEDPHYILEVEEFRNRLESIIEEMPQASKTVFLLSRVEGMSYKEIAKSLDLGVKAVEKRMSKALKILTEKEIIKKK